MSKSFQHEKPPARINLFLEVMKGNAKKKMELPLRLLVTGDFTGKEPDQALEDREIININKQNFEDVMKSSDLNVDYTVKNKLKGDGTDDMKVHLEFENMNTFRPEEVAKQVPELGRLLATRNLLQDLRNRLISLSDFRKELEGVIKDEAALNKLLSELDSVIAPDGASGDEEESA